MRDIFGFVFLLEFPRRTPWFFRFLSVLLRPASRLCRVACKASRVPRPNLGIRKRVQTTKAFSHSCRYL